MSTNMKNVIATTFFAMVQERGFDKITVKDLVETCHISRQTFYYHFQDILDVVEWSARRGVQRAVRITEEIQEPSLILEKVVEIARDNWKIVENLIKSQKREDIERIFAETLREYLLELVTKNTTGEGSEVEDAMVAIQFYSSGIAGVLMAQCGRPDCDPKRLARQLMSLVRGGLFAEE